MASGRRFPKFGNGFGKVRKKFTGMQGIKGIRKNLFCFNPFHPLHPCKFKFVFVMATKFDYSLDYKNLDLRKNPELYRVGKGEQGVLMVEPYRTEIVPHWRFKTPEIAGESSEKIYEMFLEYKRQKDFVGMDMARKFLQMGITRARRYANHPSGRKYKKGTREIIPIEKIDEEKAESARIFSEKYYLAKNDEIYQQLMKEHKEKYEQED